MKVLLFFFVCSLSFIAVQGLEVCTYHNGTIEYCPDYGNSIGYCCETWISTICCQYTPVWYFWYFWTPMVLFILFTTICVCACKLCASATSSSASSSSHQSGSGPHNVDLERQAVITTTGVVYKGNNQHVDFGNDHLPSYNEIQQSQMVTMEGYQQQVQSQEKPPKSRTSSSSSSSSNDDK